MDVDAAASTVTTWPGNMVVDAPDKLAQETETAIVAIVTAIRPTSKKRIFDLAKVTAALMITTS
ncbi:MAG: hypothetical protein WA786_03120 [Acidimicrobiales bacterium]